MKKIFIDFLEEMILKGRNNIIYDENMTIRKYPGMAASVKKPYYGGESVRSPEIETDEQRRRQ